MPNGDYAAVIEHHTGKTYPAGKAPGNLIEMMTCEGGCIAGAGVVCPAKKTIKDVEKFAAEAEPITPDDEKH